jgi:hypothetical protein
MEIIIVLAVIALIAVVWARDQANKKKAAEQEKEWPFGKKLSEGKIYVKPVEIATVKTAEDRVEAPAPSVAAESLTTVVENRPAKKAPVKKTAAKPAAKKEPAKKKSI